jgi:phospholipid/cholesterol/gamma-HCH transport system substrate-binding protein
MSPYRRNILVGVCILAAGLIFGWMILKFSSKTAEWFAPPQIAVHFGAPRADGLSQGSDIQYLGVEVGHVTSLNRTSDGSGVTIDGVVDEKPGLPANLRARIVQNSAIGGGSIISLDYEGDKPEGILQPDSSVHADYVGFQIIPAALSNTAAQIGDMSEEIRKSAQQLRESGVIGDLDKTVKQINVDASKAEQALDSFNTVLGDQKTQENVKVAIDNIRQTTETTNKIAVKLDKLSDSLKTTSDSANTAIKDGQQHIDDLSKQVGDRMTQIAALMTSVQSITDKIDKGQGTAGQIVNDPRLYAELVDTSRTLDETAKDLKRLVEQWEEEGVSFHLK